MIKPSARQTRCKLNSKPRRDLRRDTFVCAFDWPQLAEARRSHTSGPTSTMHAASSCSHLPNLQNKIWLTSHNLPFFTHQFYCVRVNGMCALMITGGNVWNLNSTIVTWKARQTP